ncbi:hypothetical protein CRG98_006447 [Punica granatum]|uniref:Uncharacterized protein n=1 Tax=Punica granatum TaxID=22663 RepID=A0A2I0KXU9_PUNGR|nr:hypothetical protein CRG98_006447 [Punica granatum]
MTTEAVTGTKKGVSHDLWLPPLIEHATKEGQAVSIPFWPTGFNGGLPTEALDTIRDWEAGDEQADTEQRTPKTTKLALRHYSSPNHRSTERCPIWDSKNSSQCQSDQQHVRAHFRGIPHKPGHPDLSRMPFLTGLSGPAPLTSKRPPKTGLLAPKDHRGQGTSFRRPFGTLQSSPRDVSVVANASR